MLKLVMGQLDPYQCGCGDPQPPGREEDKKAVTPELLLSVFL
jgi:hypothetical protein